jgi:hypothetical protein
LPGGDLELQIHLRERRRRRIIESRNVNRSSGYTRAARSRALTIGIFAEAPLLFLAFYVWLIGIKDDWKMQDFAAVRSAAISVLHGHSPYPLPDPQVLSRAHELVYPPLVAYLFVPFAAVPSGVAAPLYFFLTLCALAATLRLAGVHDWRCYGVVMLWYPTIGCLGTGALGPFLALLLAISWRLRDRPAISAPVLAAAIVAKLFLWPLVLWLVATRRWRAAAASAVWAVALFLVPFTPLGWQALRGYPHLLRTLDGVFGHVSFSADVFFRAVGLSPHGADAAVVMLGALLAIAVFVLGARKDDPAAFTVALAAALLVSPIVWMHYYILLVVPIGISAPTLSAAWFAPLVCWGSPELESFGSLRRLIFGLGAVAAVSLAVVYRRRPPLGRYETFDLHGVRGARS